MTGRTLLLFSAVALLATQAFAQDASDLRDDQLLGEVAVATEMQDADRLLALMTEARARGLLMFAADGPICEPTIPETSPLASLISRGSAQWAYITRSRMMAMEAGDCGCPFSLLSFDDFALELTGSGAADLTPDDLSVLQAFRTVNEKVVDQEWRDFRQNSCGG